ncbi:hypothetical protein SAMN06295905_2373 [Devosia lucknowensis]|uniref:Uncharacterized protein n=1 Tax=Devosia lucknowensis TaxID=1096929 RepID=A0A1Y6FSZ5_9HYPH|nr:hypothetical protein [Devosia lucknowensis]SMQ75663.1 hypothetical protein SAMN06295905_2373 [Devosia lucknowensis]
MVSAPTEDPAGSIKRQAIVIVHGQGEQRPMGTIRDFVRALWQDNPELDTPGEDHPRPRPIWIVPDDKSGLYELQRITTPEHNGRRSDFFELYYADLLNATPLRNLWRWIKRLLWVDPAYVPKHMRWPWRFFWALTVLSAISALLAILAFPQLFDVNWYDHYVFAPEARRGQLISLAGLLLILLPKFLRPMGFLRALPRRGLVLVIAIGILDSFGWNFHVFNLMLLGTLAYLASTLLLPYFGDAASYLSAQTETVQSRQGVRNRGLALLKALHNDPEYDRVVIIAHSLGSVLAYDLLHILWREVGPTKDNPPTSEAIEAFGELDAFVRCAPKDVWSVDEVGRYQRLQWRLFRSLSGQKPGTGDSAYSGWKISDLITLGSPLSSAEFLVTDGHDDFTRMKTERVLPTAPPQPYDETRGALYEDPQKGMAAHHAAVFSAVRWTNIFDRVDSPLFLLGDAISGPLAGSDRFGPGIADINVEITWGRLGWRVFTHNWYWTDTAQDGDPPAAHLRAFRKAVGLERSSDQ